MAHALHTAGKQLEALRGAAAWEGLRALSRQLAALRAEELDRAMVDAPADVLLAAALVASDLVDRATEAGPLAERAEPKLTEDPGRRAVVCLLQGISAFHAGRFAASIDACARGMRRLGTERIPMLSAQLLAQQAVGSKHLGRRDDALGLNLEALRHAADASGDEAVQVRATLHNNIGVLLLAQGDQQAAVRHLERALDEASEVTGLEGFRTMVHLNVGRLLLKGGADTVAAAVHLERGAELAEIVGSEMMQMRARESLALARRRQGRLDDALALLHPLVEHWSQSEDTVALAGALLSRGRVHSDLGNDEAEADILGAFHAAESTESFDLMLEATQALTAFLEQKGRHVEACAWHHRRHELERVQFDREKSARMQEMHARHRVEQAERELIVARDRAEAASRAKSGFLAVTSHELRTPLNAIIGYTELLLDDSRDGIATEPLELAVDLDHIHTSAMRLQRLIDRILLLTSLDEGDAQLAPALVEVATRLRGVVAGLQPAVAARGNRLQVHVAEDLEQVTLWTDASHLDQIVQHLVDNAAAFTENGEVTVTARRDGEHLLIEVRDTGKGFDTGSLDELLQPFQQTDMSYTRGHGGLGLGLTLCRHQVDLLGGTLTAESQPGQGSTFRVTLPWREGPEGVVAAAG